jgi:hypothetical protein
VVVISGVPDRFDDDFDLTVQNLTSVFEDFTDARDTWRSARSRMVAARRDPDPDWFAVTRSPRDAKAFH